MKRRNAFLVMTILGLSAGVASAGVIVGSPDTFTVGGVGADWGVGAPDGWQSMAAVSGNNSVKVVYGSEGTIVTPAGAEPYQWQETKGQPDPGSHSGDPGTMVQQHMCNFDGGTVVETAGTQIQYITFTSQPGVTYKLSAWVNTSRILNPSEGNWDTNNPYPLSDYLGGHARTVGSPAMPSQFANIQVGLKVGNADATDLTTDYTQVIGLIDNLQGDPFDAWVQTPDVTAVGDGGPITIILKHTAPDISSGARSDLDIRWDDVLVTVEGGNCTSQHTTIAPVSPTSIAGNSDVTITITGTELEFVTSARLVPAGGGASITGTNLVPNNVLGATSLDVDFATTGAALGMYHIVTEQNLPCASRQLLHAFEVTCANPTTITGTAPNNIDNPEAPVELTISGTNVDQIESVQLVLGSDWAVADGTDLTVDGSNLLATFDLSCVPAGTYILRATRTDGCPDPVPGEPLADAVLIRKVPAFVGACHWKPWAASWSNLNLGEDLSPPDEIYNPTNWDYSFSQVTDLGMTLDTPDASDYALHYFYGPQTADGFTGGKAGSGGVYQEIAVTPGVPLDYSYYWKAEVDVDIAWFELILIDGPFSLWYADAFQEQTEGMNNPSIIRKRELTDNSIATFGWEQVTDDDPATPGSYGPRPTTITPTGNVATVVLKAGRYPGGASEVLFDNVQVWQGAGPNLVANGDFEASNQLWQCSNTTIYQEPCENDFWLEADLVIPPPCGDPFADADRDGDVDQDDFGAFQQCLTGMGGGPVSGDCLCFDRIDTGDSTRDDDVDQVDYAAFEACASGPGIPVDIACDDNN